MNLVVQLRINSIKS